VQHQQHLLLQGTLLLQLLQQVLPCLHLVCMRLLQHGVCMCLGQKHGVLCHLLQ
jgi:hypothetical protein